MSGKLKLKSHCLNEMQGCSPTLEQRCSNVQRSDLKPNPHLWNPMFKILEKLAGILLSFQKTAIGPVKRKAEGLGPYTSALPLCGPCLEVWSGLLLGEPDCILSSPNSRAPLLPKGSVASWPQWPVPRFPYILLRPSKQEHLVAILAPLKLRTQGKLEQEPSLSVLPG